MSGHTPGPWMIGRIALKGEHISITAFAHGFEYGVGKVYNQELERETEHYANARLIAAAPDLLEAARLFVAYDESDEADASTPDMMASYFVALEAARAAIAKAEGRA